MISLINVTAPPECIINQLVLIGCWLTHNRSQDIQLLLKCNHLYIFCLHNGKNLPILFFFAFYFVFFAYPPTNLHFLPFKCYIADDDPHEILLRIGNPAGLASLATPVKNNMFYRVILTLI